MTLADMTLARQLLADRTDRTEQTVLDTGGYALTAYWRDGSGQKLFYTLEQVERHVAERTAR